MKKGFTLFETLLTIVISCSLVITGYMIVKRTITSYKIIENYQDEVYKELKEYYKVMNYFKIGEIRSIDYNRDYYNSDYFIVRANFIDDFKEMKIVFNDSIYLNDIKINLIPTRVETNGSTLLIYVLDKTEKRIICIRGITL